MIIRRGLDPQAPLADRERLHRDLLIPPPGAVVLSTCDRVEVYEGQGQAQAADVLHLFRVVSGLESPLLGEHQIQGQVKRAYEAARQRTTLDAGLHRLFQQALRVGKRVRHETALSVGALGHAQCVVQLLGELPVPLAELRLLVLGVNNLNWGILKYLTSRGVKAFYLGNRSLDKARRVVAELGSGTALGLEALARVLPEVDAVVSATSAPHLMIHEHQVPPTAGPRWYFDLAVPRDIDPALALRPGVQLFNVADLEALAQRSLRQRRHEVAQAESILAEELERFVGNGGS